MILNKWLPVDKDNPIPKPTNERQVLIIYNLNKDNTESKLCGTNPFLFIGAGYYLVANPRAGRVLADYLFWNHNWMYKHDDEKVAFVYELDNLQYMITEASPIPAPTVSGDQQ